MNGNMDYLNKYIKKVQEGVFFIALIFFDTWSHGGFNSAYYHV